MIDPDYRLIDDGTLDTVIYDAATEETFRFSPEIAADYRDPETGALDWYTFINDVVEACR